MMKTSCAVGYCYSQLSRRKQSQAVSGTHTMKASLVGLFNGLLLNKTVETVQGLRGKCGNLLLGLGHSGGQPPTGQYKSAVLTTSTGQREKKERTVGEMLCFKDSLRSAKRFPNQTAAFDSCLCYVQLNLR